MVYRQKASILQSINDVSLGVLSTDYAVNSAVANTFSKFKCEMPLKQIKRHSKAVFKIRQITKLLKISNGNLST